MYQPLIVTVLLIGSVGCSASTPHTQGPLKDSSERVISNAPLAETDQIEVADIPKVPVSTNVPRTAAATCRKETELGSRRIKRRCRTRSQIEQSQAGAESALEELQRMEDLNRTGIDY